MEDRELTVADEGAYDKSNPTSLINLIPPAIQEHLLRSKNFFLNDLSADSLRKNIKNTPEYKQVRYLRQSFWLEYSRAISGNRKMQMTRVWQGISESSGDFYNIMKKDHFAAYIFTKPMKQEVAERELLEIATEQMMEILSAPHLKKDGSLDAFAAKVKLDLYRHLDERVQGGIIKQVATKIDQRNLNVSVTDKGQVGQVLGQFALPEEVQRELESLKAQEAEFDGAIETTGHVVGE